MSHWIAQQAESTFIPLRTRACTAPSQVNGYMGWWPILFSNSSVFWCGKGEGKGRKESEGRRKGMEEGGRREGGKGDRKREDKRRGKGGKEGGE